MVTPRLSIVIPCYNSAAYIEATLYSIASQDCSGVEVIVIDDQSTDESIAVASAALAKYGLYGQVVLRPPGYPKGVAGCRQRSIKIANAGWIAFLDSDDLFCPGKISATLSLADKYGATCGAFHHGIRQFEDGTNKTISISNDTGFSAPRDILPELIHKNTITTSSVTIKKALLTELGGFDGQLHGVEDYLLWLRVSKKTKWFYSREAWTDYRVRSTSLMGGREMIHYVTQNNNLYHAAKSLAEFSKDELSSMEYYLFDYAMKYYALVSLNTGGWADLLKGLCGIS